MRITFFGSGAGSGPHQAGPERPSWFNRLNTLSFSIAARALSIASSIHVFRRSR
jgi:hypothetical protein